MNNIKKRIFSKPTSLKLSFALVMECFAEKGAFWATLMYNQCRVSASLLAVEKSEDPAGNHLPWPVVSPVIVSSEMLNFELKFKFPDKVGMLRRNRNHPVLRIPFNLIRIRIRFVGLWIRIQLFLSKIFFYQKYISPKIFCLVTYEQII